MGNEYKNRKHMRKERESEGAPTRTEVYLLQNIFDVLQSIFWSNVAMVIVVIGIMIKLFTS